MTRTDVMASSRPRTVGAAPMRKGSSRIMRRLSILPLVALLALALVPGAAVAAEPTSGYGTTSTSTTPTSGYGTTTPTPTTSTTTPSKGVAPAKEAEKPSATTPASETAPAKTSTTPTTGEKASTLPFTGFDLRWDIGFGLLLMLAGFSIVLVQRRQRRDSGR
jgi:cytoskeletal protein RodZ